MSQNIIVSTLYTNLGDAAICDGINTTEVSVVITSSSLLSKLRNMLDKCPYVKHIIVIEDQLAREGNNELQGAVEVLSFYDVVNLGKTSPWLPNPPDPDDLAI